MGYRHITLAVSKEAAFCLHIQVGLEEVGTAAAQSRPFNTATYSDLPSFCSDSPTRWQLASTAYGFGARVNALLGKNASEQSANASSAAFGPSVAAILSISAMVRSGMGPICMIRTFEPNGGLEI